MIDKILIVLLQHVVPIILGRLIDSDKAPSITEGMVKDYEVKVGVHEPVRIRRALRREGKGRRRR